MEVAVVGAGVLGLAHAYCAAVRGHRVTVFERSPRACGASVRNFGMIWPIGQPTGHWHSLALRSRQLWLEIAAQSGIWLRTCGSIHLAHRTDEWQVLEEFASLAPGMGYDCQLLQPREVLDRTPAANPHGLLGGLFSSTECAVSPPDAIGALPTWLQSRFGVQFHFQTLVRDIKPGKLETSDPVHNQSTFDRIVVCSGSDLQTLFPSAFASQDVRLCKLQMMRTIAQPTGWDIGLHIASGLTLRHYTCFQACASLAKLRERIAHETPELDRYGIHVMASQDSQGRVILGDSHEYDAEIEPFDSEEIDRLILRELSKIITLPTWQVEKRWHGIYCKYAKAPWLTAEPFPGVSIRNGLGGSGMTMSMGLAEQDWQQW